MLVPSIPCTFARSVWCHHWCVTSASSASVFHYLKSALLRNNSRALFTSSSIKAPPSPPWITGGKIQTPVDPALGQYAPGQTFIHSKLGCYGTVLTTLDDVELHRTEMDTRSTTLTTPTTPTALLRPTQCAKRDGMVRMINERGLELYLGSGDETDGHTKELAEKTVTVGEDKWYQVIYHESEHQGKPGLETTGGVVTWVEGLKQYVPGLAVCNHADVQPITFPDNTDGSDGDRLPIEHRNIQRALKRAGGPAFAAAAAAAAAAGAAEAGPHTPSNRAPASAARIPVGGVPVQALIDALLAAATTTTTTTAASRVVVYTIEDQGIEITAVPSSAGRLEPDGAYAFNVMVAFTLSSKESYNRWSREQRIIEPCRLEDRELVFIEASGRVQVGKGSVVRAGRRRSSPIILSQDRPAYYCTIPITVSTSDATIGGFFRFAREKSGARFEVPLPTIELSHTDRRNKPFGGMGVRLALNP